jgi:L-aspartate oxidase
MKIDTVKADVLVVGAGPAGIMATMRAQEKGENVLLLTNGALGKHSAVTWMTGCGFQCALYPPDSPDVHARDTVINGCYINNQELVLAILQERPRCISDLDEWGERFWKEGKRFVQDFMPGHSHARHVVMEKTESTGEIKGYEHRPELPNQLRLRKILVFENFMPIDPLAYRSKGGRCYRP